jgi:HNH endonuclease
MKQLEIIFHESAPKAARLGQVKRKHVRQHKPEMLRGPDGRIIGLIPRSQEQLEKDFWERVKIGGLDECWEWQAGKQGRAPQYGIVWCNGQKWIAHRFAYSITRGQIPDGLDVLHRCDNPPCCNPVHIFAGTHQDNMRDCIAKGRANREYGEHRYNAVLTEARVIEIRNRWRKMDAINGTMALAAEFGVGPSMISAIVHGKRWKHLLHELGSKNE